MSNKPNKLKVNFIPSDIGCNMSLFAIVDNENIDMSKLYMI